jgi:cytochrome P450
MRPQTLLARGLASLTGRLGRRRTASVPTVADQFDLNATGATRAPFPAVERLRSAGPVHFLPRSDCWIVVGHEEVRAALAAPHIFSSSPLADVDPVLLGADPPSHAAVRRVVAAYIATMSQRQIDQHIAEEAAALIVEPFDLVTGYSVPLARKATALILGLDAAEVEAIRASPDLTEAPAEMSPMSRDRLRGAALHRRLLIDGDGLIDDDKACSLVRLLCRAAAETTERLIVRAALALLQDGTLRGRIEASKSLLIPFVDEAMRLYPPEPSLVRVTTMAVELGGRTIPAGAALLLSLLAANRDPSIFPDPAQVKLDRPRAQHVAFGGGIHQCVGAGLARRIALVALRTLLDSARRLRPVEPFDTLPYVVDQGIETPQRVMITA